MEKKFPYAGCNVCKEIINLKDGFVWADDFLCSLKYLFCERSPIILSNIKNNSYPAFVDAVSKNYLMQFEEHYKKDYLIASHEHLELILKGGEECLRKVIDNPIKGKWGYLLIHNKCVPDALEPSYCIELEEINTPGKFLEWSQHLNENKWFNGNSWIRFSEDLFGRMN